MGGLFSSNPSSSVSDAFFQAAKKWQALQNAQLKQNIYGNGQLQNIDPLPHSPHFFSLDRLKALQATPSRRVGQRVPDAVTPLLAWRAWGIGMNSGGYHLIALGQDSRWPARKAMEAVCTKGGDHHPAPDKNCQCGIWAFRELDKLYQAAVNYSNFQVLGQVSLWGRIIECENGFRAQFAYPHELWLLYDSLEELGYTYNVPIRTLPSAR